MIRPVYHESSPSPLKLPFQAYSNNFGGVSFSCPNSDDESGKNDSASMTYIKQLRKKFIKEKIYKKPPRLLSNDLIEQEKTQSICGFIQEESVFFSDKYVHEEVEDIVNDEEEEDDDEDENGNEFILTMAEESKKNTQKTNSILQVLKLHSK